MYGEVEQFASWMQLSEDPETLVRVLQRAKGEEVAMVAGRLAEVTGEAFGSDVAAWQAWLESRTDVE